MLVAIGNDMLTGGGGSDTFVFDAGIGNATIIDFSGQTDFDGGTGEGDTFAFDDVLLGTFGYRGSQEFTGTGNTEARVASGNVLVDIDGSGVTDITIAVTGLTSATQLNALDFLFT